MDDNPVAHAVLTVREGPWNLYLTFKVAQGIFESTCNILNRFIVLYEVLCDYSIYSSNFVLLEAMLPTQIPHFYRFSFYNYTLLCIRA